MQPSATRRLLYTMTGLAMLLGVMATPAVQARHLAQAPAAPKSGGTISVRDPETPDCLDPQRTALGASFAIFNEIADTLVTLDSHNHLKPGLALKWKFSHGGTWITFFLRHGVRFSDGKPLTAADVKATFDRAVNPATKSPLTAGDMGPLQKTVVVNPYEVRLEMKAPYRPLMTNLAISYEGILDTKAMAAEGNTKACQFPVGSGPFAVKSVAPAFNTVTLTRNSLHTWNPPWIKNRGKAYLSSVVFKPITSDATAISELLAGQLDITNVPGPQLNRVEHNSSVKVYRIPVQGENYIGFNTSHKPFDNPEVRKGIAEAIDRAGLIKAALNKLGKPAYSPIPSTLPYYDKKSKGYAPQYNPEDAQKILSANHVTGPYTLLTFNDPTYETAAEFIQAELQNVGVKVNIVPKPIADYTGVAGKGQFDMNILGWGWSDPDFLYSLFHSSQENGNGINFTFYKSSTLDGLIVKGRETLNAKKAAAVYAQLQQFMDKNVIIDPLWIDVGVTAVRSRVGGFHTDAAGDPVFQDMYIK